MNRYIETIIHKLYNNLEFLEVQWSGRQKPPMAANKKLNLSICSSIVATIKRLCDRHFYSLKKKVISQIVSRRVRRDNCTERCDVSLFFSFWEGCLPLVKLNIQTRGGLSRKRNISDLLLIYIFVKYWPALYTLQLTIH